MSRRKAERRRREPRAAGAPGPAPAAPGPWWPAGLWPLLVGLVAFAAFLPALSNEIGLWDDEANLLANADYRGLGWAQLRWMVSTFHMGHYIPVTWLSLGLDYVVWGMRPAGYHLTSVLLHAAGAGVFYLVARRLLAAGGSTGAAVAPSAWAGPLDYGAAFAALLFAVHPLRVESVA
ncbi:MAG: hypothetical protein HY543_05505, partial [Deltaproteobacteria bacterium]|nr:hypothetical protein [Deltaproteobacteria bacterium]